MLKFQGYWNDRSEFGDVRRLDICYYLADDTIDIKEKFPRNSGREGTNTFLKRGKLPKEFTGLSLPGQQTAITLLNVLGSNMRDVRYVADPLNTGQKQTVYYTDQDLRIGAVLNVFGRDVVLTSCDQFTQQYYREKVGCFCLSIYRRCIQLHGSYENSFPSTAFKTLHLSLCRTAAMSAS